MRFRLRTLILIVVLVGGAAAAWRGLHGKRGDRSYHGYFQQHPRIQYLLGVVAPAVSIEGSGGGETGGDEFFISLTHYLKSDRAIGEELINGIRRKLREDLRAEGIEVVADKDVNGSDSQYVTAGVRHTTWGFQLMFNEHGHRGVVTVRLMSKTIPGTESTGHQAELWENIVVFPRD